MTETRLEARIVRITVDQGRAGLLYATSPDLKGLLVAEASREALDAAIPGAIADLYAACGEPVFVIPTTEYDGDHEIRSWIKVPAEVARTALEAMNGHA